MLSFSLQSMVPYLVYIGLAVSSQFSSHPIKSSFELYEQWIEVYDIDYIDANNKFSKYSTWKANIDSINKHNSEPHSWSQGVNHFTGLSFDEFSDSHLMDVQHCSATAHNARSQPSLNPNHPLIAAEPPKAIDWRTKKIISEVKNQGACGSCWSFSSTGCLEAHYAQYTGQLTLFAEQHLIDCSADYNNHGCNGGLPSQSFEYVMYNGGLDTEFFYHYVSGTTKSANANCSASDKVNTIAGEVYGVYNVTQYNETDIYQKVGTVGPVSICYDVASDFKSYSGGVYSSTICKNTSDSVNHAVLAVGYGVQHDDKGDVPFWIVKNSWGWSWGMDGYFLIERGVNMCGVSTCASFPIVDPNMIL